MITYEWNCRTVDVRPAEGELTDVVYNVHYIVTGNSDKLDSQGNPYYATNIGTQVLDTTDITDFIPFEYLTNEQIAEWTKATIGEEGVSNIEQSIANQIDDKINPKSITLYIKE